MHYPPSGLEEGQPSFACSPINKDVIRPDLGNREACMWLSVNQSAVNLIWVLSGYETLETTRINGASDLPWLYPAGHVVLKGKY